jgi:hypothetical protein
MHYNKDFAIECRIARFHNIYGPHGTWKGGREKAPAAFCRKVCGVGCPCSAVGAVAKCSRPQFSFQGGLPAAIA